MMSSDNPPPDTTKILFLLHIIEEMNKKDLATDESTLYDLIKNCLNEQHFRYAEHNEYNKDNRKYHSSLNRDLFKLIQNETIEINPRNTIILTQLGKEVVEFWQKNYQKAYESIKTSIESYKQ